MKDVPLSDVAYQDTIFGFKISYPSTWSVEPKNDGVMFSCQDPETEHGNIHIIAQTNSFDNIDRLLSYLEREYSNYLNMTDWTREKSTFKHYDAIISHNRMKGKEAYWEFEVIDFISEATWFSITVNYDGTLADVFTESITPIPPVVRRSLETLEILQLK